MIGVFAFSVYYGITSNLIITPATKVDILYLDVFIPVSIILLFTVWLYSKNPLWYWVAYVLCTAIMWYYSFAGVMIIISQRTFLLSAVLKRLFKRELLRENSSTFCEYVHESTLPRKTKTMHCSEDNVVSGNLIVVCAESGSRGGYATYDADMGGLTPTDNFASAQSNCVSLKGSTYSRFIQAVTTSDANYTDASGTIYKCGTCDAAGANLSVTTVKFADKSCVNMFGASDVACPVINGTYDIGSQRPIDATADSVVTNIDLDTED